jgi:RNA polymerase sigma-70 factor (ECF subfamily)
MAEVSEGVLVEEILAGNKDVYRVLVERYKNVVFNLAYRMTGSPEDALDISQETFIRAYQSLGRFRVGEKFFTWLYTICLNVAKNHLRQRSRRLRLQGAVYEETVGRDVCPGPEDSLLDKEEARLMQGMLLSVPEHYRAAVVLRYNDGLSYEEISQALGISVSGAKMRVKRGLDKLRSLTRGEAGGQGGGQADGDDGSN